MVELPFVFFVMTGEVLLIVGLLFLGHKMYQDSNRIGMPVLRILLAAVICINIWALSITHLFQLWPRIVAAASAQYGIFFYYVGVKQMFKNGRSRSIIRSKVFWSTSFVVGLLVILDILLRGQPPFDSSEAYISSWPFYTEAGLGYGYLLFLGVLIIKVYLEGLQQNTNLAYQGRFGLFVLAFSIILLALLLVEISLCLAMLNYREYRVPINSLYHLIVIAMTPFLVLSYILPDTFFARILRPLSAYKTFRQRRQQILLHSLHQTMVRIVPGVQLSCELAESVHDLRILIEISDARQVIWSLKEHLKPIKPRDEAKYLLHLLHNNILIDPGPYSPPTTYLKDIIKHNVLVAKRLQSLQKSA